MAKQLTSRYEPGKRTGRWSKFKTLQCCEFVIGGYLHDGKHVQSLLVGSMVGDKLKYSAKVEVYWEPRLRRDLLALLREHHADECHFQKVPLKECGDTWSVSVGSDELQSVVWVKPVRTVKVEYVERTSAGLLRQGRLSSMPRSFEKTWRIS